MERNGPVDLMQIKFKSGLVKIWCDSFTIKLLQIIAGGVAQTKWQKSLPFLCIFPVNFPPLFLRPSIDVYLKPRIYRKMIAEVHHSKGLDF